MINIKSGSFKGVLITFYKQECILFLMSNWSDLFRRALVVSVPGGVPYFAQVSTTFVVYLVTNFKSKKND